MENILLIFDFLKQRFAIEAIHSQYYLGWLVYDFGVFTELRDSSRSLDNKPEKLLKIRKESVKLIRYLLDSSLFYMVDLADCKTSKTPEEIIEKIESLWVKSKPKSDLPNYTIAFDLTPKGIEYIRCFYSDLMKVEEKLEVMAYKNKYLHIEDLAEIVKNELSITDPERLKYTSTTVLFETNLEIGTLKNKKFEFFDFFLYLPEIVFINKWNGLINEKNTEKKVVLRNIKETNELIEEWQKKGGELFSKAYKWLDFSLEKAKKRWEKYGK